MNQGWLCDKGRYGFEWVHAERPRRRAAWCATATPCVEVSWPEALDAAAAALQQALDIGGPGAIAVLGGARGTNEDAYVWARFAKGVLGTDNVDAQLGDGLPADVVLGLPARQIADLDRARGDRAARARPQGGAAGPARCACAAPPSTSACRSSRSRPRPPGSRATSTAVLRHVPGDAGAIAEALCRALAGDGTASGDGQVERAVDALDGRDGDVVVVLGRPSLAESPAAMVQRRGRARRRCPNVKFLSALRRGNVHGALDLGLTPGFLPGRVTLDAGARPLPEPSGAPCPARPASTPPASSGPRPAARSTRSCCSAPTSTPTSPTARSLAAGARPRAHS